MTSLLLLASLAHFPAHAEDLDAFAQDDLDWEDEDEDEDDLDWDDDGTRPDNTALDPDEDMPADLGEDPLPGDLPSGSTGPSLSEDPEWDSDGPSDVGLEAEEPPPRTSAAPPIRPSAVGSTPLADNYPLQITRASLDVIVIELPVLVSQSRAELSEAFWIIGEIYLDGNRIGESRAQVTAAGAAEDSASFIWLKAQAPIIESDGTVEIRLSRQAVGGANQPLFTRSASY
ncbi:MAG: hypothetical protein P8R54_24360 [Myxococcota bacterium]|nr:hypothetical protein [Myxococcota bacterium]